MNTPMTIKLTVDFLDPRGPGGKLKNGMNIFEHLVENKMPYTFDERGPLGEIADIEIHIDNYFQYQALGDFLYNRG